MWGDKVNNRNLAQDNARIHHYKKIKEFYKEQKNKYDL